MTIGFMKMEVFIDFDEQVQWNGGKEQVQESLIGIGSRQTRKRGVGNPSEKKQMMNIIVNSKMARKDI